MKTPQRKITRRVYDVRSNNADGSYWNLYRVTPARTTYLTPVRKEVVADLFTHPGRYKVTFEVLPVAEFGEATHMLKGSNLYSRAQLQIGGFCKTRFKYGTGVLQDRHTYTMSNGSWGNRAIPLRITAKRVS